MSGDATREPDAATARRYVWVRPLLFFGLMYVYVWLWHEPVLLYHSAGLASFPLFRAAADYAAPFFLRPGGPAEYLAALLSLAYASSWSGAIVLVGVAVAMGFTLSTCGARVPGRPIGEPSYLPAVLILALCSTYIHVLAPLVALTLALAAVPLAVHAAGRSRLRGAAASVLTALAVYYVAGGAVYVFAVASAAVALADRERRLWAQVGVAAAGAAPLVIGVWALHQSGLAAYTALLPTTTNVTDPAACALLAALWVGAALSPVGASVARRLKTRRRAESAPASPKPARKREAGPKAKPDAGLQASLARLGFAAPFLIAALVVSRTDDPVGKATLKAQHLVIEHRWDEVLELARTLPEPYAYAVTASVDRALLESGRMPEELFAYPQTPEGLLLCLPVGNDTDGQVYALRKSLFAIIGDIDLELGLAATAEAEAFETLTARGEHPLLLERLARIHMVQGKPEAARLALRRLIQHPGYADEARAGLACLNGDLAGDTDPSIAEIRGRKPAEDPRELYVPPAHRAPREQDTDGPWSEDATVQASFYASTYVPLRIRFRTLLAADPGNRQAFELEMALYMVYRQLGDFHDRFPLVRGMGYERLPRHFQEAAVVCEAVTGEPLDAGGLTIDPAVRQAYRRFETLAAPSMASGRVEQAREALKPEFGDTFWYYYYLER